MSRRYADDLHAARLRRFDPHERIFEDDATFGALLNAGCSHQEDLWIRFTKGHVFCGDDRREERREPENAQGQIDVRPMRRGTDRYWPAEG